jgi:hypothetical protein
MFTGNQNGAHYKIDCSHLVGMPSCRLVVFRIYWGSRWYFVDVGQPGCGESRGSCTHLFYIL